MDAPASETGGVVAFVSGEQPRGKYDALSEMALGMAEARMVVVMIVDGVRGNGFSVSVTDLDLQRKLPELLRTMATLIEREQALRTL